MKMIIGALDAHCFPTCRGFIDAKTACSYAERITQDIKETQVQFIILTGDVFFVSDTGDVQKYEKLVCIYRNGLQLKPDAKSGLRQFNTGEKAYSNKYKILEE